jgi:hypothetical protein
MQKIVSLLAPHTWKIALILLLILLVGLFLIGQQRAYSKTKPYQLEMTVMAETAGSIKLDYDYGYGKLREHSRKVPVQQGVNSIKLSMSAWKPLLSFGLHAQNQSTYTIMDLSLTRGSQSLLAGQDEVTLGKGAARSSLDFMLVNP